MISLKPFQLLLLTFIKSNDRFTNIIELQVVEKEVINLVMISLLNSNKPYGALLYV